MVKEMQKRNNFKECNSGFTFLNDNETEKNNCYEICKYYYYFNKSKSYKCERSCPKEYNKIFLPKRRCIDKFTNDNIYKLVFKDK